MSGAANALQMCKVFANNDGKSCSSGIFSIGRWHYKCVTVMTGWMQTL